MEVTGSTRFVGSTGHGLLVVEVTGSTRFSLRLMGHLTACTTEKTCAQFTGETRLFFFFNDVLVADDVKKDTI